MTIGSLGVCGALVLASVACGSSGRELRAPAEGVTAPPRSTTIVAGTDTTPGETDAEPETTTTEAPQPLALSSPAWTTGEPIPEQFTCEGEDLSPPMEWDGVPGTATSLAITMVDPGDGFVHWIVVGIDPAAGDFGEGTIPDGAEVLTNDAGEQDWLGPCPPAGVQSEYELRLLALTEGPSLPEGTPEEMVAALHEAAYEQSLLSVRYERPS